MSKYKILTRDERKAVPFVLPGFIASAILIVYPLFYIFSMSFSKNGIGKSGFAGFENYARLFSNPQFGKTMINTLVWTASTVVLSFLIGLAFALLINREQVKYKGFWRSMIFTAWIIPGVVKATSWKWLFSNDGGMINHLLQTFGIIHAPVPWLISPQYSMLSLVIVQVWACSPYVMLMMTAGLQQMSRDVYESADLDGASGFQKLYKITLPMLKDVTFICVLLVLIWAINEFSLIWIMTNGGPASSTTTLSLMVYNQFKVLNLNAASASAVMQLIISMIFAGIYVAFVAKED
jgi:multiple sugar transport system permease protein